MFSDSYTNLKQNLANGNACVFIGAGLSVGANLPNWYDLIDELSKRIDHSLPPRQWITSDALIEAAQVYVNDQGLHSLIAFLKERLDTFDKAPTSAHRALARLPISLVFTANYDDLLERAYRDAGKRVEVVVKDTNIPFMRRGPDVVNIVKLYGDLNQPETLVLARQQYESFFLQRPQMVKLLEVELARSDVLYLGWSHTDPHFNLIFGELLTRFGPFMRTGYAAMFDVPPAKVQELQRKHIRLVQLPDAPDHTSQLAAWLESLSPAPGAQSKPSAMLSTAREARHLRTHEAPLPEKPVLNSGKAWAVLVGVNTYVDPYIASLKTAVSDVNALHQVLASEYQAVRLLTDETPEQLPTRANILAELSAVAQAAEAGDLLLFHFSGHGIAEDGESYLLPRDAKVAALRYTAVAIADVHNIIEKSAARAKVIVLDACHAGASIGRATSSMTPEFIQRVFAEAEGIVVLASCKQGQQSWEWREKGHGVFTYYLLEALRGQADFDQKGFVTIADVNRYVTDRVKQWSVSHNAPQTPTWQAKLVGDIILFHPKPGNLTQVSNQ